MKILKSQEMIAKFLKNSQQEMKIRRHRLRKARNNMNQELKN